MDDERGTQFKIRVPTFTVTRSLKSYIPQIFAFRAARP